jgi:hypothetical protein
MDGRTTSAAAASLGRPLRPGRLDSSGGRTSKLLLWNPSPTYPPPKKKKKTFLPRLLNETSRRAAAELVDAGRTSKLLAAMDMASDWSQLLQIMDQCI